MPGTKRHLTGLNNVLLDQVVSQILYITLQGLLNCLTDALVEYTYNTQRLTNAVTAAKALRLSQNSIGWTGVELHSLQPRMLACYAAPCQTAQPFEHFWMHALQDLPHQFALHVEMAMNASAASGVDDRPDMAPYLAMLGNPLILPPPLAPPSPPPSSCPC